MAGRLSAVPDCGFREYIIMQIDCARQRHTARGFAFASISTISRLGLLAGAATSSIRARAMACACLTVLFGAATAQAQAPFRVWRLDMQHRSEGRTGPWLAAGYAMCFRCERNGTTIRLHRHDQAPWRRYRCDKRGNAVLGCFCPKQPNRPRHAKRKLRRRQRQRCFRPGSRRQGTDRWIPPHDNVAAAVGRRPDRN